VAIELAQYNVRVNCICPGGIATPLLAGGADTEEALAPVRDLLAELQPLHRSGLPQDIANAALWLASDEASFVTGQAIVVDGGLTAGSSRWVQRMNERRGMA
jgi:NAD(P)-dependent dehydrogenase (short-subunit alcohol dehydrogenase family)